MGWAQVGRRKKKDDFVFVREGKHNGDEQITLLLVMIMDFAVALEVIAKCTLEQARLQLRKD